MPCPPVAYLRSCLSNSAVVPEVVYSVFLGLGDVWPLVGPDLDGRIQFLWRVSKGCCLLPCLKKGGLLGVFSF